jgi:hypothetical protein
VVDLAVAVFAAYGVAHLRAATSTARAQVLAGTTFAGLAVLAVVGPLLPGVHKFAVGGAERILAVGIPLAAAGLAAGSTLLIPRFRRVGVCLCCLVVVADGALSFGAFFEWRHRPLPRRRAKPLCAGSTATVGFARLEPNRDQPVSFRRPPEPGDDPLFSTGDRPEGHLFGERV